MRPRLPSVLASLRQWWRIEEAPEDRIEGSGEVHLDPAYNGRYTAERRLRQLSKAQAEAGLDPDEDPKNREP